MKLLLVFCIAVVLFAALLFTLAIDQPVSAQDDSLPFTSNFRVFETGLRSTGLNPFFILVPGYRLVLEDEEGTRLVITVTQHTKGLNGVNTRIVEERESENGTLVEISRNYFAASNVNNSVFYFGEDVDFFDERGRIISHEGTWRVGSNGAREGLIMAGTVLVGAKYFQEQAPGVALDQSEVISTTETLTVPAGTFRNVIKIRETTPLEPDLVEFKWYAPGVGLIKDSELELVSFGRIF